VGQILDEKIDKIDFKIEDLRRELSYAESTLSEVQDQNNSVLEEIEGVQAWCQAIKALQEEKKRDSNHYMLWWDFKCKSVD
jgi:dynactin complex subunit